jgi:hypothetical protein
MMYRTFTRTWWKSNPKYPDGLEPCPGRKTYYETYDTEERARLACGEYNDSHEPGRLSRKMEYEKDG